MTIRHISELGSGDVQRLGLQPLAARINTEPRVQVQAEIAHALKTSAAFRAAENDGEEGLDVSGKLSKPLRAEPEAEEEDDTLLDEAAL